MTKHEKILSKHAEDINTAISFLEDAKNFLLWEIKSHDGNDNVGSSIDMICSAKKFIDKVHSRLPKAK